MRKTELICGIGAVALVVAGIVMAVRVYFGYQKGRNGYDDIESAFISVADGQLDESDKPEDDDFEPGAGSITDEYGAEVEMNDLTESLPDDARSVSRLIGIRWRTLMKTVLPGFISLPWRSPIQ